MKYHNRLSIGIGILALSAQVGLCDAAEVHALTVQDAGSEPVATINGETITRDELTSFAVQLEQAEGARLPGGEELLNEFILTRLYDQIPTTATVEAADAESTAPTPYKLVSQRSLLKRELRTWVSENIEVPREAMEKWYEENVSKYVKPERVHAYHIFMETSDDTPSSAPEKVRSRLQDIKTQIDSGTSFTAMADLHSEAASGDAGGEIGQITRRMPIGPLSKPMNLELENALFDLSPGKASDIVDTRHGMHLLYITDKSTTRTPSLDDMISSGILPGAVAQDLLTSELKTLVSSTVEKYKGEPLPGGDSEITTDSVAFRVDGKDFTIGHLISLFGPRFTGYLDSVKEDVGAVKTLMGQALEDEAMVRAAIDKGIAKQPGIARDLELLGKRETARERIEAIADAEAQVTEAQIRNRYDELIDQLRQPEAEGYIIMVESGDASGTAEQARAREYARKKAEDLRAQLTPENFTSVTEQMKVRSDIQASVVKIPRHIVGQTTESQARVFDQTISRIEGESRLSEVMPVSTNFVITYLEKRYPGEPIALEVVRDRLESMLQSAAKEEARNEMVKRLEEKGLVKYLRGASEFGKAEPGPADNSTTAPE